MRVEILPLPKEALPQKVKDLAGEGYRLVQVLGISTPEGCELTYSLDKNGYLLNLRVNVARADGGVPSITGAFPAAFTYENELQDLFGLRVDGLVPDFRGEFYRKAKAAPFDTGAVAKEAK